MVGQPKNLDDVLRCRSIPQMRSNLEHRIIQAALARQEARRHHGFMAGMRVAIDIFFDGILLPRPALSMAVVLVFSMLLGVYVDGLIGNSNSIEDVAEEYMSFAYNSDFGDIL